jgi:type II secretory pathway pseudopilin PulG
MNRPRHHPSLSRAPGPQGITLLEVLVAVLIGSSAISLLVPVLVRQFSLSSDSSNLTAVEAVVSRDLDWISDFARGWRMQSGPYNLPTAITGLSTSPTGNDLVYYPDPLLCSAGTLASDPSGGILARMSAVNNSGLSSAAARPYPIPATASQSTDLTTVNGITVQRIITPQANRLQVRYQLSGDAAAPLRFSRQASVLIEAAAWCETLP